MAWNYTFDCPACGETYWATDEGPYLCDCGNVLVMRTAEEKLVVEDEWPRGQDGVGSLGITAARHTKDYRSRRGGGDARQTFTR